MRRALRWVGAGWLAVLSAGFAAGCAQRAGARATDAALGEVRANMIASENDPQMQMTRVAASRAMSGAIEALDAPEERERLNRLIADAVSQAVTAALRTVTTTTVAGAGMPAGVGDVGPVGGTAGGAGAGATLAAALAAQIARAATDETIRRMTTELGPDGRLSASLAGTSARMSAAAVSSARQEIDELFPGCAGPDRAACRQKQLQGLVRGMASSFGAGIRDSLGIPLLVLAAAFGIAAGALAHWLWSLRLHRRELRTA